MAMSRPLLRLVLLAVLVLALPGAVVAQVDLSGEWAPVRAEDNTANPEPPACVGTPPNDAGRALSSSWDP